MIPVCRLCSTWKDHTLCDTLKGYRVDSQYIKSNNSQYMKSNLMLYFIHLLRFFNVLNCIQLHNDQVRT